MNQNTLIGMWTLTRRELTRILRVWTQTLIPPIVTSLLFILVFGLSLGTRISEISGVSYIEFIIPGLLMMAVIMSSYSNTSTSLYLAKFQGNIQEVLVAPISYWQIIAAMTFASFLRSLIVGAGILLVAMLLTPINVVNIWVLAFFFTMCTLIFAFAGIATALWADSFDQMSVFITFLITPLTYLGGVFYSIDMLPPLWQNVSKFNPILYMVDGFRFGFIGVTDVPLLHSVLVVTVLALGFFVLCVYMFKTGYKLRT